MEHPGQLWAAWIIAVLGSPRVPVAPVPRGWPPPVSPRLLCS